LANKSPDAFRTISEVAEDLDLPQHVLRFWETRFNQIKPMKRGGGRRYYRPDDVELLKGIRFLLYSEGYTIKGVQRILKEQGNKFVMAAASGQFDMAALAKNRTRQSTTPTVADLDNGSVAKVSTGLLGKLVGGRSAAENSDPGEIVGAASKISGDDIQALNSTLMELLECKRLLDQAR
jgi:DNA-binding transcriptional MerR regulator